MLLSQRLGDTVRAPAGRRRRLHMARLAAARQLPPRIQALEHVLKEFGENMKECMRPFRLCMRLTLSASMIDATLQSTSKKMRTLTPDALQHSPHVRPCQTMTALSALWRAEGASTRLTIQNPHKRPAQKRSPLLLRCTVCETAHLSALKPSWVRWPRTSRSCQREKPQPALMARSAPHIKAHERTS